MLGPIGQISRTVSDVARSSTWYEEVLGLPHLYTYGDLAFFDCAGTRLLLTTSGDPGPPSILYFQVSDLDATTETLRGRGVEFVADPHLIHRHPTGVEEWMAFFKDPDNNLLALMSHR